MQRKKYTKLNSLYKTTKLGADKDSYTMKNDLKWFKDPVEKRHGVYIWCWLNSIHNLVL